MSDSVEVSPSKKRVCQGNSALRPLNSLFSVVLGRWKPLNHLKSKRLSQTISRLLMRGWSGEDLKLEVETSYRKVVFCMFRCQSIWVGIYGNDLSSSLSSSRALPRAHAFILSFFPVFPGCCDFASWLMRCWVRVNIVNCGWSACRCVCRRAYVWQAVLLV